MKVLWKGALAAVLVAILLGAMFFVLRGDEPAEKAAVPSQAHIPTFGDVIGQKIVQKTFLHSMMGDIEGQVVHCHEYIAEGGRRFAVCEDDKTGGLVSFETEIVLTQVRAVTMDQARQAAEAVASKFPLFQQTKLVSEEYDSGGYYVFSWIPVDPDSGAYLTPYEFLVKVHAGTGEVYQFKTNHHPLPISTIPTISRGQAERLAIQQAKGDNPRVHEIMLFIPVNYQLDMKLFWGVVIEDASGFSTLEIDAHTGQIVPSA